MLQCSHATCQKWRRVDGATRVLFGNETWWRDRLADEEEKLYQQCPDFGNRLLHWLRLPERLEVATLDEYNVFCKSLPQDKDAFLGLCRVR